jgi:phage shock protein PspC (stress-responsive transcriptional regulator)
MEKTTQITLASTVFSLTESAYEKLSRYLDSLKEHFAHESDRDEILRDIESRIAEKLLAHKHAVVTEPQIAAVIAEIGDPSDFDDDTDEPREESKKEAGSKKLYRDMDNAWIGGVASGIAAYFDIDPLLIRGIFVLSMFFGGTGVIVPRGPLVEPEARDARHAGHLGKYQPHGQRAHRGNEAERHHRARGAPGTWHCRGHPALHRQDIRHVHRAGRIRGNGRTHHRARRHPHQLERTV